uniref:Uncharacterized protein n=1 Tax=Anguilla anguilla TaxID=7936 RepID=A0A0E9UYR4_ANGAN
MKAALHTPHSHLHRDTPESGGVEPRF